MKDNSSVNNNEEMFHDEWASTVDVDEIGAATFFESCVMPENKKIIEWLGDIRGKELLELGCGLGESSCYLAMQGANVTATDLSSGMLDVADRLAEKHSVKIKTMKCNAETLPFQECQFDIVYCIGLLHHVDIEQAINEIKRVLKPGGVFVGCEPVAHNPLINLYRKMSPKVRTEDEHPFTVKDIKMLSGVFEETTCEYTWLTTLLIFARFYFIDRYDPNEIRYWKQMLKDHKKLEPMYNRLEKIDVVLLRIFPFLKKFCWNVVFMVKKSDGGTVA